MLPILSSRPCIAKQFAVFCAWNGLSQRMLARTALEISDSSNPFKTFGFNFSV